MAGLTSEQILELHRVPGLRRGEVAYIQFVKGPIITIIARCYNDKVIVSDVGSFEGRARQWVEQKIAENGDDPDTFKWPGEPHWSPQDQHMMREGE